MVLGNIFGNQNPNQNLINQFADFKKKMEGQDAEQIVKQMLKDGRMSQAQFEQLKRQAEGLMSILR